MARKKDNPLLSSVPTLCECGGKVVWKGGRFFLCTKCYIEKIGPQIKASATDIAFQKRLRDVEAWIREHAEFKTKRAACMHMLEKRGLMKNLPASLQ